jgi:hypothetical protein
VGADTHTAYGVAPHAPGVRVDSSCVAPYRFWLLVPLGELLGARRGAGVSADRAARSTISYAAPEFEEEIVAACARQCRAQLTVLREVALERLRLHSSPRQPDRPSQVRSWELPLVPSAAVPVQRGSSPVAAAQRLVSVMICASICWACVSLGRG